MEADVCEKCDNKGAYPQADGPDDSQMEFCDCPYGVAARELAIEMEERKQGPRPKKNYL